MNLAVWRALQVEDMGLDQVEFFPAKAYRELARGYLIFRQTLISFNGALYIMAHHLMVRYIVSIRHFLTLYSVNKTLFDTT